MEGITKKRAFLPSATRPAALAMHRDSHTISKAKPKIRIIHIFAPEIIKTDVANFRELVQRLTGKPAEKRPAEIPAKGSEDVNITEFRTGFRSSLEGRKQRSVKREEVEEEEEMWNGEDSGGYFGGFSDFEGFIKELGEFPLLPLDASHQIMHGFEETQFS